MLVPRARRDLSSSIVCCVQCVGGGIGLTATLALVGLEGSSVVALVTGKLRAREVARVSVGMRAGE